MSAHTITQSSCKTEGKYQKSIQSSTTPDPGHHIGKQQKYNKKSHTREPRGQPFFQQRTTRLQRTNKKTRQTRNTGNKLIQKRSTYRLGMVSKNIFTEGLKLDSQRYTQP